MQYAFKNKAGISRPVSTFQAVRGFSGRATKYSEVIGGSPGLDRRTLGGQWGREVLPGSAGPGVELCRLSRAFPVPRFNRVFKMPVRGDSKAGCDSCGMNARKKLASNATKFKNDA